MSGLGDIVARSRSPGTFVARKHFTLSRDKAIEKLREYTLRDPRQYVLELVAAAVHAGAGYIAVDVEPGRLLLAWVGGRPYREDELSQVFDYLFADRSAAGRRPVVQLAVALNALLQRRPAVLRVESGSGADAVRLDLDAAGRGVVGRPDAPLIGTYIVAEFRQSWLQRFNQPIEAEEARLVRERCRYTPVPILLNGEAPFGYRTNGPLQLDNADAVHRFEGQGRRGAARLIAGQAGAARSSYDLVVGGVWVSSRDLPRLGTPSTAGGRRNVRGVLCDDQLRKTADQSDVVEDQAFLRLLHWAQPHVSALLLADDPSHSAPALPAVAPEDGASALLPPRIPGLGAHQGLSVDAMAALPAGEPLFWVLPTDQDRLIDAADPSRFPWRVLVLGEDQARTLQERLPGRALNRLTQAADADFVARVQQRAERVEEVQVPHQPLAGWTLHLRFWLSGRRPRWGVNDERAVPLLARREGRTVWTGGAALDLPGLAVVVDLPPSLHELPADLAATLEAAISAHAWRVAPAPTGTPEDRAWTPLVARLIGRIARPQFVDGPAGTRVQLAATPQQRAALERLRPWPLARRQDGGDLLLDDWLELLGQDRVVAIDELDLAALDELELHLGPGHLRTTARDSRPIRVLGQVDGQWRELPRDAARGPELGLLLWVAATWTPGPPPAGATAWPSGLAGVGLASPADHPPPTEVDWLPGLVLLHRLLLSAAQQPRPPGPGANDAAMEAGVLLQLSARLGRLHTDAIVQVGLARRPVSWSSIQDDPHLAVAARHGPLLDEPATIVCSRDELRFLEEGLGRRLPLRWDDDPSVWRLLGGGDGDPSRWLCRQAVDLPGLSGWLGLRLPPDPTAAVMLAGPGGPRPIGLLDRSLPCHGMLALAPGQDALRPDQEDSLRVLATQLFSQLGAVLSAPADADPERRRAAVRYALVVALRGHKAGGALEATARSLAAAVQLAEVGGGAGALLSWLDQAPEHRPELPDVDPRWLLPLPRRAPPQPGLDMIGTLRRLLRETGAAVEVELWTQADAGPRGVQVNAPDGGTRWQVVVDPARPWIAAALLGPGQARTLLLVEAVGRLAAGSAAGVDLYALHGRLAVEAAS